MSEEVIEIDIDSAFEDGSDTAGEKKSLLGEKRAFPDCFVDGYGPPKKKSCNEDENRVALLLELLKRRDDDHQRNVEELKKMTVKYNFERLKSLKNDMEHLRAEYLRIKEELGQSDRTMDSSMNMSFENEGERQDYTRLQDLQEKVAELKDFLKAKDDQLNFRQKELDNLYAENLVVKGENEKLLSTVDLNSIEIERRKQQSKRLEEKLAHQNEKQTEEFETLKTENKFLEEKLKSQKADFERERRELVDAAISDEINGAENEVRKQRLTKLASENDKLTNEKEKLRISLESMKEENEGLKRRLEGVIDELERERSDFERQRCSTSSDEAKLRSMEDKIRDLESLLKAKEEKINCSQFEIQKLSAVHMEVKEELDKSRSELADKEDFVCVSETNLVFDGKIGHSREFVIRNNVEDRVAFDIPYGMLIVSPDCGVLEVGEVKTISVRYRYYFEFGEVRVNSVKVPTDGGNEFVEAWFQGDPSKIKTKMIFCQNLQSSPSS